MSRDELAALTRDFLEAFNRDDLDAVMEHFADDGTYDEFHGAVARGKAAVRAAFEPQFRGDFGTMRFRFEDQFVDPDAGKVMVSWTCTFETGRGPAAWRGLDLLQWKRGKLVAKNTYCKAKLPFLDASLL